jgi:thiosulfate/3-mercaptopyruvate sulfurtransferase
MVSRHGFPIFLFATFSLFLFALLPLALARAQNSTDPWAPQQTVQPADLAKELGNDNPTPTVLFVGFRRLYIGGHIKGAQFHGSGGSADGVAEIKSWATPLPRSTKLVIYCGCCPMAKCPNIRPAYIALHEMGFTNLHVLILPTSFAADWAEKGLPYDKGQ